VIQSFFKKDYDEEEERRKKANIVPDSAEAI
jgi:hypothetical protein